MKIKSKKLKRAFLAFVKDMETRLAIKGAEEYQGWDNPAVCGESMLLAEIISDAETQKHPIPIDDTIKLCPDIANRAMMISYRAKQRQSDLI